MFARYEVTCFGNFRSIWLVIWSGPGALFGGSWLMMASIDSWLIHVSVSRPSWCSLVWFGLLVVGLVVVEPGKSVCIIFWMDPRLHQVGEPSVVSVRLGGGFLALVIILVSLLVSEIVAQLSINDSQLSLLALRMALL